MSLLRQVLKSCVERTPIAQRLLMVRPRRRAALRDGGVGTPEIALTFDDGPHPQFTPRLLDELRDYGIKATFFLVGQKALQYADIVYRIADEGHALGNHTFTHFDPANTPVRALVDELRRTRDVIESISGQPCTLFRPPKGRLKAMRLCALWRERQSVILWNVDPRDYLMRSDGQMQNWCREYRPGDGDIVLMHDDRPYAMGAIATLARTSQNLPTFVRITDWLS